MGSQPVWITACIYIGELCVAILNDPTSVFGAQNSFVFIRVMAPEHMRAISSWMSPRATEIPSFFRRGSVRCVRFVAALILPPIPTNTLAGDRDLIGQLR